MNNNHPQIKELYKIYKLESNSPFRKVHRMIDLFESIIKTHTIVIMAEYFKRNQLSDAAKGLLAVGLRTPSLGTWQLFSRELFKELKAANHVFLSDIFPKEFEDLDKALNNQKTNVISFRNGYAHGATPSDADCEKDIQQFEPFLERLLATTWIANTDIIEKEGRAILISLQNNDELSLHPLLIAKAENDAQPFAFFNDLKDDKVGLLNYPLSKHYREKDFFSEFNSYLPLKDWKKNGSSEFNHRIDELTETFKGRVKEREMIQRFVESQSKGYLSIQGNPGIGKSALIAKVYIDLTSKSLNLPICMIPYFIRRGTAQADSLFFLNFLLKNTDHYFSEGRNISADGKSNWDLQQQLFSKWRAYGESNPKNKLVFLIDGLDEGVENEILRYLPRENFNHVLIIYGSRPGGHKQLESFWGELPFENHSSLLLTGLNKNDIRALLYEVSNKYEIEKNSVWIERIEKRSEGNPLYLKLLCNAIENGSLTLNDPDALPKEIDDYYKAILDRYANNEMDGDSLLNSLYTFAAALDYLTPDHLKAINGLGEAQAQRVESTLKEVLYENPLTEEVLDYQLFHESFREYLFKHKINGVKQASERILKYCADWEKLKGAFEQRYSLQHYAHHLCKLKNEENINTLLELVNNEAYIKTQKKVLQRFEASKELFRISLTSSIEIKNNEEAINSALKLIDLKYEEQNDVANIMAMVANNEIDLALQRITSFGGPSREDKQRQFILFMLCFMELTLLGCKEKPWRKSAIEKLLNHFDEQIPIDHSILNWNDIFPSYLVFQMAIEMSKIRLDYLIIYKRSEKWESDWIIEKVPYTESNFQLLLDCTIFISDDKFKSQIVSNIACALVKHRKFAEAIKSLGDILDKSKIFKVQEALTAGLAKDGRFSESLQYARGISHYFYKCKALMVISKELYLKDSILESESVIQEAIDCTNEIKNNEDKSTAIAEISTILAKQDNSIEASNMMQKALLCARGIRDEVPKSKIFKLISANLAEQGNLNESGNVLQEALAFVLNSRSLYFKCLALCELSDEMANQDNYEEASNIINFALSQINEYPIIFTRNQCLKIVVASQVKQGKIESAIAIASNMSHFIYRRAAFNHICVELTEQRNLLDVVAVMSDSLKLNSGISDDDAKWSAITRISKELSKQKKINEAIICVNGISESLNKTRALINVMDEFSKYSNAKEFELIIQNTISQANKIKVGKVKFMALSEIAIFLAEQNLVKEAIDLARSIIDEFYVIETLGTISTRLSNKGELKESDSVIEEVFLRIQEFTNFDLKSTALSGIASELACQKKADKAFEYVQLINKPIEKTIALKNMSIAFAKHVMFDEAFKCVNLMNDDFTFPKSDALQYISYELVKQNRIEEALTSIDKITNEISKSGAFRNIITNMAKNDDWFNAEKKGFEISEINDRQSCWKKMARDIKDNEGWQSAIFKVENLRSDEAKLFYLKGWVDSVSIIEADFDFIYQTMGHFLNDSESLESLLQKFALNQLFYSNANIDRIIRLNKTLNIQWAMDIKAQFPKSIKKQTQPSNVDEWINDISDEDDKEQVLLWAKQVSKGKLSEQDFLNNIKSVVKDVERF